MNENFCCDLTRRLLAYFVVFSASTVFATAGGDYYAVLFRLAGQSR